jgi:phosphoglycolate phosphatase-like HAD superfamily hydrolase
MVKKLLLWDIDGTIMPSTGVGEKAIDAALFKAHGKHGSIHDIDYKGKTDTYITHEMFKMLGIPENSETVHSFFEAYFEVLPDLLKTTTREALPGVANVLELAHQRKDLVQGLLTGNVSKGAEIKLAHYQVWHYFEFGAFGSDSPNRNDLGPVAQKRAKEIHDIEFPPENIYIIGDTPNDVACAKAIRARCIAVATGAYSVEHLKSLNPDFVLPDLSNPDAFFACIDAK